MVSLCRSTHQDSGHGHRPPAPISRDEAMVTHHFTIPYTPFAPLSPTSGNSSAALCSCSPARKMPVRAREESDTEMLEVSRSVRPRGEGFRRGPAGYVRPAERLHTVEDDPNLLAIPSAYFARRTWMVAHANEQILHAEWQRIKHFYVTMTDFAKLQSKLDREVDPEEVALGPWLEMIRENIQEQVAGNRMSMDTVFQFELLHARIRTGVEEGRLLEVLETMAAMQALFERHAKMWLDYNACIPRPYRLTMAELWPWVMQKWVMSPGCDDMGPELSGFFGREVVPDIMEHVVTVYCEAE